MSERVYKDDEFTINEDGMVGLRVRRHLTASEKQDASFLSQLIKKHLNAGVLKNDPRIIGLNKILDPLKVRMAKEIEEDKQSLLASESPIPWVDKIADKVIGTTTNTKVLLDYLGITCRYNEMSKELDIDIPNQVYHRDTIANTKVNWIESEAARVGYPKIDVIKHLDNIGSQNAYHPFKEFVLSKPWDGEPRMQSVYETIVCDDMELRDILVYRFFMSVICAVFQPRGIEAQGVLTFQGAQGIKKSRYLATWVPNPDWISNGEHLDPYDKDCVARIVSKLIVELGEIDTTFKITDISALKAFITRKNDTFRPAYARKVNIYDRRTMFYGTVNKPEFLNDTTGNRRFWTLSVKSLFLEHQIDIQQMWAEMYFNYCVDKKNGKVRWWLNPRETELLDQSNVKNFTSISLVEEKLFAKYRLPDSTNPVDEGRSKRMQATELAEDLLKNPTDQQVRQIGDALRRKGAEMRKSDRRYKVIELNHEEIMKHGDEPKIISMVDRLPKTR